MLHLIIPGVLEMLKGGGKAKNISQFCASCLHAIGFFNCTQQKHFKNTMLELTENTFVLSSNFLNILLQKISGEVLCIQLQPYSLLR